ncbi:hypothetical protein MRB53_039539 [Persea americana]|nr:hypothetical protein MRB53_039539 [Persea americana]
MIELIRETAFGQLVRLVTRNKVFQYPEEADPERWKQYIDEKKSGYMAHHGTCEEKEYGSDEEKEERPMERLGGVRTRDQTRTTLPTSRHDSDSSSRTRTEDTPQYNGASGVKIDAEKGKDVWIVDWYGDNDPELIPSVGVYIGSAIYTAGIETVMLDFGVSQVAATLGLTLFVAGYGLGMSSHSEPSALILPTGYAVNFGMLLAFRFLTGFFGSPVLATGGASLSDMYIPKKRAYAIAIWGIAAVCGPVMGPLVGGFAAEAKGWQWTIWELTWLSGFAWVFLFFFLPETSANNILYRRTRRLRKLTGNDKLKCAPEIMAEGMTGGCHSPNGPGEAFHIELPRADGFPPELVHCAHLRIALLLV